MYVYGGSGMGKPYWNKEDGLWYTAASKRSTRSRFTGLVSFGNVRREMWVVNGLKDGLERVWDRNGVLRITRWWKKGKKEGEESIYEMVRTSKGKRRKIKRWRNWKEDRLHNFDIWFEKGEYMDGRSYWEGEFIGWTEEDFLRREREEGEREVMRLVGEVLG
jgi:hypothetical protein